MPLRKRLTPNQSELIKLETGDFHRASGSCICSICKKEYYDHPMFEEPYEFLNRICNGEIVKL